MATPKNLISIVKKKYPNWVKSYKITEAFYVQGELYLTSHYDLPPTISENIENYLKPKSKPMAKKKAGQLAIPFKKKAAPRKKSVAKKKAPKSHAEIALEAMRKVVKAEKKALTKANRKVKTVKGKLSKIRRTSKIRKRRTTTKKK